MTGSHLRELIDRTAPGRSTKDLTDAAGVPESRLTFWLRSNPRRVPTVDQVVEVARIIGCKTSEAYRAIRADVDPDAYLDEALSDDERELLATYRRLRGDADRQRAIAIVKILGVNQSFADR